MGYFLVILLLLTSFYGIYLLVRTVKRAVCLKYLHKRIESFLPNAVLVLDRPLQVLSHNRYSIDIFPFFYEELAASNLWELWPSEVAMHFYKGYKDVLDLNKMQTCRFVFLKDEETLIELELRFVPLRCKYIVCVMRILKEEVVDKKEES